MRKRGSGFCSAGRTTNIVPDHFAGADVSPGAAAAAPEMFTQEEEEEEEAVEP